MRFFIFFESRFVRHFEDDRFVPALIFIGNCDKDNNKDNEAWYFDENNGKDKAKLNICIDEINKFLEGVREVPANCKKQIEEKAKMQEIRDLVDKKIPTVGLTDKEKEEMHMSKIIREKQILRMGLEFTKKMLENSPKKREVENSEIYKFFKTYVQNFFKVQILRLNPSQLVDIGYITITISNIPTFQKCCLDNNCPLKETKKKDAEFERKLQQKYHNDKELEELKNQHDVIGRQLMKNTDSQFYNSLVDMHFDLMSTKKRIIKERALADDEVVIIFEQKEASSGEQLEFWSFLLITVCATIMENQTPFKIEASNIEDLEIMLIKRYISCIYFCGIAVIDFERHLNSSLVYMTLHAIKEIMLKLKEKKAEENQEDFHELVDALEINIIGQDIVTTVEQLIDRIENEWNWDQKVDEVIELVDQMLPEMERALKLGIVDYNEQQNKRKQVEAEQVVSDRINAVEWKTENEIKEIS